MGRLRRFWARLVAQIVMDEPAPAPASFLAPSPLAEVDRLLRAQALLPRFDRDVDLVDELLETRAALVPSEGVLLRLPLRSSAPYVQGRAA